MIVNAIEMTRKRNYPNSCSYQSNVKVCSLLPKRFFLSGRGVFNFLNAHCKIAFLLYGLKFAFVEI